MQVARVSEEKFYSAHKWEGPKSLPLSGVHTHKVMVPGRGECFSFHVSNQHGVESTLNEGDWVVCENLLDQHNKLYCWGVYSKEVFEKLFRPKNSTDQTLEVFRNSLRGLSGRFKEVDGTVKADRIDLIFMKDELGRLLSQLDYLEPVRKVENSGDIFKKNLSDAENLKTSLEIIDNLLETITRDLQGSIFRVNSIEALKCLRSLVVEKW